MNARSSDPIVCLYQFLLFHLFQHIKSIELFIFRARRFYYMLITKAMYLRQLIIYSSLIIVFIVGFKWKFLMSQSQYSWMNIYVDLQTIISFCHSWIIVSKSRWYPKKSSLHDISAVRNYQIFFLSTIGERLPRRKISWLFISINRVPIVIPFLIMSSKVFIPIRAALTINATIATVNQWMMPFNYWMLLKWLAIP